MSRTEDFAFVRKDSDLCKHQILDKLRLCVTRQQGKLEFEVVEKNIDKYQDYVTVRPTCERNTELNGFQQGAREFWS